MSNEQVFMPLEEARALAVEALLANGADRENAEAVAGSMAEIEAGGGKSHGFFRLKGHCDVLAAGQVNGSARPSKERLAPGVVGVEGDGGFSPLALSLGLPALAEVAREQGVAVLGIRRAIHFAALWPEASWLAKQGLVAMACTSSPPYVAPAGGTKPFFGTNPMAFAWPRGESDEPMVWDQASAATARGELMLAARDGHTVPEGAGIDRHGAPTTDPKAILEGAQLAFGGYKGAAIALMVDLLAGPLLDEVASFEAGASRTVGGPTHGGELILAIDPARFGASEPRLARSERLFAALLEQDGTRLPGGRRAAARARCARDGVAMSADAAAQMRALAAGA